MRSLMLPFGAFLGGVVLAQKDTNSSDNACTGSWELRHNAATGPVNSTGSGSLKWPFVANLNQDDVKPWYISVLVNNTDLSQDNGGTMSWPFLSVPNGVEASACVYQFGAQNATSTGDVNGALGCGGVFTNKCIEFLKESVSNNSDGVNRCNLPASTDEELKRTEAACGDIGRRFSSFTMRDLGNASASCSYNQLSGVDLPEDYLSRQIGMSISPYADQVYHNDMAYNLSVTQTTTFVVVAAFEADNIQQKDVSFVCVTSNNTKSGISLPEDKAPWKISDAGATWRASGRLSILLASMAGLMLAL